MNIVKRKQTTSVPSTPAISTTGTSPANNSKGKGVTNQPENKQTLIINSLADLAKVDAKTGTFKQKRYSGMIVKKDEVGECYVLRNSYFTEDGSEIHIPSTAVPFTAVGNQLTAAQSINYVLSADKQPTSFTVSNDISAGLALLEVTKNASTVKVMSLPVLMGFVNGVHKDPTFFTLSSDERVEYILNQLQKTFGTIVQATNVSGNPLFIALGVTVNAKFDNPLVNIVNDATRNTTTAPATSATRRTATAATATATATVATANTDTVVGAVVATAA